MRVMEAKRLEPTNPYVLAFEERIKLLEKGEVRVEPPILHPAPSPKHQPDEPALKGDSGSIAHSLGELEIRERLREEIEVEFRSRFTAELQQQEANAMHLLEQERHQLQLERDTLQVEFDRRLAEMQEQMQQEFQQRFEGEAGALEARLREQFQLEQSALEESLRTQLEGYYTGEIERLQSQLLSQQQNLVEQERQAFSQREKAAREQFDRQLLDALRKTEQVFQAQGLQQQQLREEQLREELSREFEAAVAREREIVRAEFATMRDALEQEFRSEQSRLEQDYQTRLQAELAELRKQDEANFEAQRQEFVATLEAEMREQCAMQIMAERDRLAREAESAVEAERAKLQQERESIVAHQNEHLRLVRADLRREMEETFLRRLEKISREFDHKMEILGAVVPKSPEEAVRVYREKMMVIYKNGMPSVEDAKKLMALKEILELTFDAHLAVEADVRLALYVASVERKILSGELNPGNTAMLETLKKQFAITTEESARLEPYILSSFQRFAVKGRVCLVDDDPSLLTVLEHELSSRGYQVVSSQSIPDAMEKLSSTAVDLILSDIKFPDGEPDGFKFFGLVQEQPHLRKLPFVFMSALQDGVIVRSGVQLGIDDYVTKPLDLDLLNAIIEGKLKRYRRLQPA